jgi:hypothetical protein
LDLYSIADAGVLALHILFNLWVAFGALVTRNRPLLRWFHIASLIYGILLEILDWTCPLTPMENWLWSRAGAPTYQGGFLLHYLDVLVYPANQARPATHEGGLERYGEEPGTCEESAMTGLPQVTVPAGMMDGRYPFGISLLGRQWADRRVLALAYAYEQATHHRRSPVLPATRP